MTRLGVGSNRVRQILRRLRRDWHYSLGVVLVLAIGIGPATVGLSVREDVLVRPLGYHEPDRLGVLRIDLGELRNHSGLAQTEIVELREAEGPFQAVESAIFDRGPMDLGDRQVTAAGAMVTPGLLHTLGVRPTLGRLFREDDERRDVIILSHSFWQTQFSGDPNIIGRGISLYGLTREVIGVLPPDFTLRLGSGSGAPSHVDFWGIVVPQRTNPRTGWVWGWNAVVRLKDGISVSQANEMLQGFARRQTERYPRIYAGSTPRFTVTTILADLVQPVRPALRAALLGVLLLLVTAVVNASALLMLASKKRGRELAVRSAIGAGRGALLLDGILEGLILGIAGITLGWLLAAWGITGVRTFIPHAVPRWETISFGWGPAAQVALLALLGLVLAGTISPWKAGGAIPLGGLARARGGEKAPGGRSQAALVGAQVTLAVVLLFGAAQLGRSTRNLAATDLGFEPEQVLAFQVDLYFRGFTAEDKPWENQQYHRIRDRLRAIPGVRSVGAVSSPPLWSRGTINTFTTSLSETRTAGEAPSANFYAVLPGYFESVGIQFLQGRDFTDQENLAGRPVAIIDETLARRAFADNDPIGQPLRVHVPGGSQTPQLPDPLIVGVVRHARVIDPTRDVRPQIYLPYGLWRWAPLHFTVRADGDPTSLLPQARTVVDQLGVGYPLSREHLLTDNLDAHTRTLRSITLLVLVVALSASLLCVVGLFAVASYVVEQGRRATAIRGALGASPGTLLREQLRGRSAVLAVAVPAGMLLSLAGARVLESLVYGVDVWDTTSLLASACLGALIGLLGTWGPARRAARTDPASVLRAE